MDAALTMAWQTLAVGRISGTWLPQAANVTLTVAAAATAECAPPSIRRTGGWTPPWSALALAVARARRLRLINALAMNR